MSYDFIKIGRILKTFGIDGDLRFQVAPEFDSLLKKNQFVFVEIDGLKVPFLVRKLENHRKPIIALTDIENEQQASLLSNGWMYINRDDFSDHPIILREPEELQYAHLTGFKVQIKGHKSIGTINRIEQYPGQEMAMVSFSNVDHEETLIPLVPAYILKIDQANHLVSLDLPEGLLEPEN